MSFARTANLLGALSLGIADEIRSIAEQQAAHGGATPGALATIGHEPGLSIDFLSRALGMSHPGAVRLIDRLVADGLVERRSARDGRAVALYLTRRGEQRRTKLLTGRRQAIEALLKPLSESERSVLAEILDKVLAQFPRDLLHAYAICRLCEDAVCDECPVDRGLANTPRPQT
jgi:MarR family transcriptional repressor of emrRAB